MENYKKVKTEQEPLDRSKVPIPGLPENFLWMQVKSGTKIRNILEHAFKTFPEVNTVVWTGYGPSVTKTVTCAEIMKRKYNSLHQITKLCYTSFKEYWDPLEPLLDQLVVEKKVPTIHICLSTEELSNRELGYQAPGASISI